MAVESGMLPAARRKRVQIIKRIIIIVFLAVLILPVILCAVLLFRVRSLEDQIGKLQEAVETAAAQTRLLKEEVALAEAERAAGEEARDRQGFIMEAEDTGGRSGKEFGKDNEADRTEDTGGMNTAGTRRVYLTFDDGPSSRTDDILDILAEYDVKATFFVVGKEGEWAERAYRRIVEEGHTLAMHSYTHKYSLMYTSVDAYAEDLSRLQEYLYDVTGVWCRYVRFPGGSSNRVSQVDIRELIAYLDSQGLTYFDWNVSSQDASVDPPSADAILRNCLWGIGDKDNVIILMHDAAGKKTTVDALPRLIEEIQKMDNTELLPITDDTVPVQHITITQEETED